MRRSRFKTAANCDRLLVAVRLHFYVLSRLRQLVVLIEDVARQFTSLSNLLLDPCLISLLYLVLQLLSKPFLARFLVTVVSHGASEA